MFGNLFKKNNADKSPDLDRLSPDPDLSGTFAIPRAVTFFVTALAVGAGIYVYQAKHYMPPPTLPEEDSASMEGRGPSPIGEVKSFWDFSSGLQSIFGVAGELYGGFSEIALHMQALLDIKQDVENNWTTYLLNGHGETLEAVRKIRDELVGLHESGAKILQSDDLVKGLLPGGAGEYLALHIELGKLKDFFEALFSWLDTKEPRRVALLLLNTSEIRPSGGFLGSYAEVSIDKGSISGVLVRDINEADRELAKNIVPPVELQLIVNRWRAADANWFFDSRASGEKILSMLEASNLYVGGKIKFDAVIAVTPKVIMDVLHATGPIVLSDKTEITSENFMGLIQEEVQEGQAKKAAAPKQILKSLAPMVLEAIKNLSVETGKNLLNLVPLWAEKKDLTLYSRDVSLESYFDRLGISGGVPELSQEFYGDYLAIVAANIGGGKSDARVEQKVKLESQIGNDGLLTNHLTIEREHRATTKDPSWYRMTNQAYLRILSMPNAQLINVSGFREKKITPPVDYMKEGFSIDPDLDRLEESRRPHVSFPEITLFKESERAGFGGWVSVERGKKSLLIMDYRHRLPRVPSDGQVYEFVFDKQMGMNGSYKFTISAPVGFRFKENGLPVYEYESSDLQGRVNLNLTLKQIL